jgi:nicotinate-nucleotide adenylyltransferase
VELERPGTSYSIETIEHFRREFGPETLLYFILGLDAFLEIDTWKDYAGLFRLCHFVVMTRPGFEKKFSPEHLPVELAGHFCYDTRQMGYAHVSGFFVYPREITALDISSTRIRESLASGRSVRYLLPGSVEAFIRRNRLYTTKDVESKV